MPLFPRDLWGSLRSYLKCRGNHVYVAIDTKQTKTMSTGRIIEIQQCTKCKATKEIILSEGNTR